MLEQSTYLWRVGWREGEECEVFSVLRSIDRLVIINEPAPLSANINTAQLNINICEMFHQVDTKTILITPCSGSAVHVVRRTGKVRWPETDVLPLRHSANQRAIGQ